MGEARSLVEGYYEAFNKGDMEAARPLFTKDVSAVDAAGTQEGFDDFREFLEVFLRAAPDASLTPVSWVEQGNIVATEGLFRGTFTGPLASDDGDIEPTGMAFNVPFLEINEVQDGRIRHHRVYYDQIVMLTQMGIPLA